MGTGKYKYYHYNNLSMSILISDIDNLIVELCDLEKDFPSIMLVNKHYNNIVTKNKLYIQRNICYTICKSRLLYDIMDQASIIGFLDLLKYYVTKYTPEHCALQTKTLFTNSCCNGHLEIAKYIQSVGTDIVRPIITNEYFYNKLIEKILLLNHTHIVDWLHDLQQKLLADKANDQFEQLYIMACTYNALRVIQGSAVLRYST